MRIPVILKTTMLIMATFIAGALQATNYYVDASTTATLQNGSQANPWKTLAQVNSNMSLFAAGDFISFKRGGTYAGQLSVSRSGTAGNPITFNAYGTGADPIFSGTGSRITYLVYVNNRSYVTFDGINITDPTLSLTDRTQQSKIERAFYIDGSSNNVVIKNCSISLAGVGVYLVGSNNTIDNCTIENLRMVVNTNDGGYDDYGANPVVVSSSNNNITNNRFLSCWANSYDFGYDGGAVEFFGPNTNNNFVGYNVMSDNNGLVEFGSSNGGTSTGNKFVYNKLINNGSLFYINNSGPFAITVSNLQFYNNVIVETVAQRLFESYLGSMAASSTNAGIVVLKNNVFWLSTGIDVARSGQLTGAQMVHEDNIYKLGTGSVLNFTANTTELTTTSNSIFTNTTSSDPVQWNYLPATTSPAIDFGQNLGLARDFEGNPVPAVPNSGVLESAAANTLSASATAGTISCNGGTTSVTVSGNGGTAPYTGTGTFTVSAGTHNYTITDAAGLTKTVTIVVPQPTAIAVTVTTGTIATFGGTTSVSVAATGGTGSSYSYSINGGNYQATANFTGIPAGNHSVNVKDVNACVATKTFSITQPAANPLSATSTAGTISCNGGTTTVTVSGAGGTAPYTGTGTFTVGAGTHTYTVTDANGVTQTTSVNITEPSAIVVSATAGNITVFGGTTTVSASAFGGTGSYTYKLNNGSYQTSASFANVPAGNHTITVKDANGCTSVKNVSISQPASALSVSATPGTISCNGGTTTVTVSGSGGTAPYTGTGSFTVGAGTHNYTITDANGVTQTTSVTVTEPSLIVADATAANIPVFGGTTTITASATGGTGSYTYKLNNGAYQSSNTFSNVAAGTHTIRVRDANSCIVSKTITITQPASALSASSAAGTISCNGGTTTVTVSGSGGTAPYTGTGTFTVSAGTHTYTVTDANGATQTTSVSVTEPSAIVVNAAAGTIAVFGGTTTVTASANGGTGAYTYKLNNGAYQSSNTFSNVAAGNHTVTVMDANGCTSVKNITISQPAAAILSVTATAGTISCNGGSTNVTVTAIGGTAPYTGTGTFTATAGTVTYTVRDANGTTQTATVNITQPTAIAATVIVTNDVSAYGGTTSVSVAATGGAGNYTYRLNNGNPQSSPVFAAVGVGNHTMTITDGNGCTKTEPFSVALSETAGFKVVLVSKTDATCRGAVNGTLAVTAVGGRAPYTYTINNGRYSTTSRFSGLAAGAYRVYAKDANGNVTSAVFVINDGRRRCSGSGRANVIEINTFPNPSAREFSLVLDSETEEDVIVEVMDMNGNKVYQVKGAFDKKYQFGQSFRAGTYFVRVTQGAKVTTQKIVKM